MVGLHRAVCLVLGERAEVVHSDADGVELHSTSMRPDAPSVIRRVGTYACRTATACR